MKLSEKLSSVFDGVSRLTFRTVKVFSFASLAAIVAISSTVISLSAFEAHIINVTAQIEPCVDFEIRSMGFWKTHAEFWVLPQVLGADSIDTPEEAASVFDLQSPAMADKVRAQLLALKFNIAYFNIPGSARVPGENMTIVELIAAADEALSSDPLPPDNELELLKDRIELVNTAELVSVCARCPEGNAMISSWSYLRNGADELDDLTGNVEQGDHLKVTFAIARGCDDVEVSFVSYTAPEPFWDEDQAYLQEVFDYDTGFFDPGIHTMEIDVPECYFQVDFVKGPVLFELGPPDNFYGDRLLDYDNGGENVCVDPGSWDGNSSSSGSQAYDLGGYDDDGSIGTSTSPLPEPSLTPSPSLSPEPSSEPTASPEVSPLGEPSPLPSVIPESSPLPEPSPLLSRESSPSPSIEPSASPEPSVSPSSEPSLESSPTPSPSPEPSPEPTPTPTPSESD